MVLSLPLVPPDFKAPAGPKKSEAQKAESTSKKEGPEASPHSGLWDALRIFAKSFFAGSSPKQPAPAAPESWSEESERSANTLAASGAPDNLCKDKTASINFFVPEKAEVEEQGDVEMQDAAEEQAGKVMTPMIASIANQLFYDLRNQSIDIVKRTNPITEAVKVWSSKYLLKHKAPELVGEVAWLNIRDGRAWREWNGHSHENHAEANATVDMIRSLLGNVKILEGEKEKLSPQDIGVVCMYKAQAILIRKKLRTKLGNQADKVEAVEAVENPTVDVFKGREKEIVLFSWVGTGQELTFRDDKRVGRKKIHAFLRDPHRFYVALTKAKSAFFIIANKDSLKDSEGKLLAKQKMKNGNNKSTANKKLDIPLSWLSALMKMFEDMDCIWKDEGKQYQDDAPQAETFKEYVAVQLEQLGKRQRSDVEEEPDGHAQQGSNKRVKGAEDDSRGEQSREHGGGHRSRGYGRGRARARARGRGRD